MESLHRGAVWRWKIDEETGEIEKTEEGFLVAEKIGDPYWVEVIGLKGWQ